MRDVIAKIHWPKLFTVLVVAVAVFTFLGPFNTYSTMSIIPRFIFWMALITGCGLFAHLIIIMAMHSPRLANYSRITRLLTGMFIASFPGLGVFLLVDYLVRDRIHTPGQMMELWLMVFVTGTLVAYFNFIPHFLDIYVDNQESNSGSGNEDPVEQIEIPFLSRLADHNKTRLVSMSMHDHYVQVITTKGKEMIYLRFEDALNEIENYPGIRIHRSHWVANEAVTGFKKAGRNFFVQTIDGQELPVSLPYRQRIMHLFNSE